MIEDTLAGLNYLHSQIPPVVHGCIRMDKLYIDTQGTTKIGEFGLASLLEDFEFSVPSISLAGQIRWMSPELLQADTDRRLIHTTSSDVWALGCTLFEIMSGKVPYFRYKHDLRVRREIMSQKPPGHRDNLLGSDFTEVWEFVSSCWEWTSEKRPPVKELVKLIRWPISSVSEELASTQSQTAVVDDIINEASGDLRTLQSAGDASNLPPDELDELEKAIEHTSRALISTPDDPSRLPTLLAHLGRCHKKRFEILGELYDLEKAVECTSRALALTPDGHPDLPHLLANQAEILNDRFRRLGELNDLEREVEYASRALDMTPDGHPDLPKRLANLGASLNDRFTRLGELDDVQKQLIFVSCLVLPPMSPACRPARSCLSYHDRSPGWVAWP
ncbi:hypothetical protein OPQ81_003702 [Rhizoctonia solani]|nr:hypothetical protein OPQ81_003702 [Rhizoctonia solani]